MHPIRVWSVLGVSSLLLACLGCGDLDWNKPKRPPESKPVKAERGDPLLEDTIGKRTLLGSAQPVTLRGFGVVIGLGDNGGGDCPTTVREYLIDYFSREYAPQGGGSEKPRLSPQKLLDSPDTAVVTVTGIIPAGAPKGAPFDIQVEAIGPQVKSLEAGILLTCELKQFDRSGGGAGTLTGRPLARARGPVFTNPFAGEGGDTRRGFVLGGGKTLEDRRVQLLLTEPSYATARRIQNRINERFGQRPPAASAVSAGGLELHTPSLYAREPEHFTALVTHLYQENAPAYLERKLVSELSGGVVEPNAELERMSWIWEGIGRLAAVGAELLLSRRRECPFLRRAHRRAPGRRKRGAGVDGYRAREGFAFCVAGRARIGKLPAGQLGRPPGAAARLRRPGTPHHRV